MEKIFYNGTIITMDEKNKEVEAVYVKEGKIAQLGTFEEVSKLKNDQTEKFINAMPDDMNNLDLDVDKMLKQAEKLSQLEHFDVIKKI